MQEDQYTKEFEIRWGDIDANRHVTNIAYSEYFVHTRFSFLRANNLDQKWFDKNKLGPAVLHDEIFYLKEISPDEKVKVNIMLDGRTEDYKVTRFAQILYNGKGELASYCLTVFAWMDLEKRKIAVPPQNIIDAMNTLRPTKTFEILDRNSVPTWKIPEE